MFKGLKYSKAAGVWRERLRHRIFVVYEPLRPRKMPSKGGQMLPRLGKAKIPVKALRIEGFVCHEGRYVGIIASRLGNDSTALVIMAAATESASHWAATNLLVSIYTSSIVLLRPSSFSGSNKSELLTESTHSALLGSGFQRQEKRVILFTFLIISG
jgi:hypothetical protein